MIRSVLENISGIAAFPIISLVLFVLVFAGALFWVVAMRRGEVEHASRLPLEDGEVLVQVKKEQDV